MFYTDAPEDYDGFGTRTVASGLGKTRRGTVRTVAIDERHLRWQQSRYDSGLYLCCPESEYRRFVRAGIIETTTEG